MIFGQLSITIKNKIYFIKIKINFQNILSNFVHQIERLLFQSILFK